MKISETREDYLEKILMIKEEKGYVKSVDIASRLEVSKPTVSVALKKLEKDGYITMGDNKNIDLTEKGLPIAENTYEKHKLVSKILIDIGVSEEQAYIDACHIEHCLSRESFDAIKRYINDKSL